MSEQEQAPRARIRTHYTCSKCRGRWQFSERFASMPFGMVYVETTHGIGGACFYFCGVCWSELLPQLGEADQ